MKGVILITAIFGLSAGFIPPIDLLSGIDWTVGILGLVLFFVVE